MRIGFDAKRFFYNREGLGSYARTLILDLAAYFPENDYFLFTPSIPNNSFVKALPSNCTIVTKPSFSSGGWWRSKGILKSLEEQQIDVYFGLSNELPFGINQTAVRAAVMIHDLLYRKFPQQFSFIDRQIYQIKFRHAIKNADLLFATSQSTKADMIEAFGQGQTEIIVAYQSISSAFRNYKPSLSQTEAYFLVVGTVNERKNLRLLVEAYQLLTDEERIKVKIVGRGGRYKQEMEQLIISLGLVAHFEFLHDISNEDLADLYYHAKALVFPSKYEGFGIPIVESLSLGTPVVALNNSSIPEVLGNCGIIVEYNTAEALKEALIEIQKFNPEIRAEGKWKTHLSLFDSKRASHLIMNSLRDDN